MSRSTRRVGTLVLTVGAVAYLVWKIELGTTLDILRETSLGWFALAVAIMVLTVPVLAARWGWLLRAHGIEERLTWLTRAYFVAYAAGQILPTSLCGEAVRVATSPVSPGPARPRGSRSSPAAGSRRSRAGRPRGSAGRWRPP